MNKKWAHYHNSYYKQIKPYSNMLCSGCIGYKDSLNLFLDENEITYIQKNIELFSEIFDKMILIFSEKMETNKEFRDNWLKQEDFYIGISKEISQQIINETKNEHQR